MQFGVSYAKFLCASYAFLGGTNLHVHTLSLNLHMVLSLTQKGYSKPSWVSYYSKNFAYREMLKSHENSSSCSIHHSLNLPGKDRQIHKIWKGRACGTEASLHSWFKPRHAVFITTCREKISCREKIKIVRDSGIQYSSRLELAGKRYLDAKTKSTLSFSHSFVSIQTSLLRIAQNFQKNNFSSQIFSVSFPLHWTNSHEARISCNRTRCVILRHPGFRTIGETFSSACSYLSHIVGIGWL